MQRDFVVDGIFYQVGKSGIARVWNKLLEQWVISGFAERVVVIDRNRSAQRVPGVLYHDAPPFFHERTDEDRRMLQALCDHYGARGFISTYYSIPVRTPSLMMVHDMIPEVLGWDLSQPMWQQKREALQYASAFVTVSTNTADDVRRLIDRPQRDITVALNGCDFTPPAPEQIQAFLQRHGIDRPYFMLSGSRGDYKNAILFFKAFERLGAERSRHAILCTGGGTLEPEMAACVGEGKVFIGILSDEDLRCAYAGARALVYPSLYEGFGLPVLEAMACGAPVISSRSASLPEVGGDAPLYVDVSRGEPDQAAMQLADHLRTVCDPAVRDAMVKRGVQQAAQFTWSRMAEVVQGCLEKLPVAMSGVKVSVITTCLNEAAGLERAIASVQQQTGAAWEHIVIDRGSSDETQAVLAAHPHLVVRREPGLSRADAMNLGVSLATGQCIGHLGALDQYQPGVLAAVGQAAEGGARLVMGHVRILNPQQGIQREHVPRCTLDSMLRHWETDAYCQQPLGYFCDQTIARQVSWMAADGPDASLAFLLEATRHTDVTKLDVLMGVSEDGGQAERQLAQLSPAYWRPSTFPFIDAALDRLEPAAREAYEQLRRHAYMSLQAEANRQSLALGCRRSSEGLGATVTVVIPTYNDAATLERAIASALNQTYPHVDVLVIDDAGPAQAKAWVDAHYEGNPRVRAVRHPSNKMLGGARNTGIAHATGDYIYFLDADDDLLLDAVDKLVSIACHCEADVVQGGIIKLDSSGQSSLYHQADFCSDGGIEGVEWFAMHRHASVACGKLYRTEFLHTHAHLRFLEGCMHEDVTFALRTAYQARRVVSISDPVFNYYTNDLSLTQRMPGRANFESYVTVYRDLMSVLASFRMDDWRRPGLIRRVVRGHIVGDFIPKMIQSRARLGADEFSHLIHDVGWHRLGPDGVALANMIDVMLGVVMQPRSV